jgi:hypothetical protein
LNRLPLLPCPDFERRKITFADRARVACSCAGAGVCSTPPHVLPVWGRGSLLHRNGKATADPSAGPLVARPGSRRHL